MVLEARQLTVAVAGRTVCNKLDFTMREGECWGIMGGNGIGKTTLLLTLAGLRQPVAGEILVNGSDIGSIARKKLARLVGMMFQDSNDVFPVTVWETAMTGRYPHQSFWSVNDESESELVAAVLEKMELLHMKDRQIDTLSGGERRRLAIATLMIQDPQLWFMDEPTNHLDIHHQISTLDIITTQLHDSSRGAVLVMHDINLVSRYCSHALLMLQDEILTGSVKDIINGRNIERLFGHPVIGLDNGGRPIYIPA